MSLSLHQSLRGSHGPAVVLLHGWGMHSGLWGDAFVSGLALHCRVICIDLPGHGGSITDTDWDLVALSRAIVDQVGEAAHYIGWSLGGYVALQAALIAPRHVRSVSLCCASPRFMQDEGWPGMSPALLHRFASQLQENYLYCMRRFLALQTWGMSDEAALQQELNRLLISRPSPGMASLRSGLRVLESCDLRTAMADLNVPMLALYGGRDKLVPAALAPVLLSCNPSIEVHTHPDSGHMPFISHQQWMLDKVLDFIKGAEMSAMLQHG